MLGSLALNGYVSCCVNRDGFILSIIWLWGLLGNELRMPKSSVQCPFDRFLLFNYSGTKLFIVDMKLQVGLRIEIKKTPYLSPVLEFFHYISVRSDFLCLGTFCFSYTWTSDGKLLVPNLLYCINYNNIQFSTEIR